MGEVRATLGIWAADSSRVENVDLQVATGASYSQLPDKTLRDLGWIPTFTAVPADLADGTQSTVALGEARILQGLRPGADPVNHRLTDLKIYR